MLKNFAVLLYFLRCETLSYTDIQDTTANNALASLYCYTTKARSTLKRAHRVLDRERWRTQIPIKLAELTFQVRISLTHESVLFWKITFAQIFSISCETKLQSVYFQKQN